jgi:hypothetical protein
VRLGCPNPSIGSAIGVAAIQARADAFAERLAPVIADIKRAGCSTLREIAAALQARGVATPRGGTTWSPSQVSNLLAKLETVHA